LYVGSGNYSSLFDESNSMVFSDELELDSFAFGAVYPSSNLSLESSYFQDLGNPDNKNVGSPSYANIQLNF